MAATNMDNIQCVSELRDAGIKFKRKENSRDILDITFENGTIELPDLQIEAISARTVWNLVAFEQSQEPKRIPLIMSSYLALMDSLVNTDKDIAILEQSGIVDNFYQNTEDPTNFFNQFAKNFRLYPRDNCFHDLCKDIREYSGSTWHRYRAKLMQDYFSTPWSIISVVAAGILLILNSVQTYYSAAN